VDNTFPTPPPAPDPAATRTLSDFVLDDSPANPVALLADGPVVVLRRSAPDRVEVFQAGHILDLVDDTPATTITDIGQSTWMIRNALTAVTQQYRYSQAQVTRLREDTDRLRSEARSIDALHTTKLADIRAYAIERHRTDEICRSGLDDFLDHFGMPEYQPRIKVQFRITGCYEVDSHNEEEVRDAATELMYVDLHSIDGLVSDSDEYTITVTAIEDVSR
jgi:hypothetical protein